MTADEMVRKIHTLEGAARLMKEQMMLYQANQQIIARKLEAMIHQQNQLLGAIRGLEGTGAPRV